MYISLRRSISLLAVSTLYTVTILLSKVKLQNTFSGNIDIAIGIDVKPSYRNIDSSNRNT